MNIYIAVQVIMEVKKDYWMMLLLLYKKHTPHERTRAVAGALSNFKEQTTRILVATDIAARGIDIDDLAHVINYELPNVAETYVHRIGRTGRAGANGTALSFCDALEKEYLRDIEKLISKKIEVVSDHAFPLMDHNPPKPEKQAQRPPRNNRAPQQPVNPNKKEFIPKWKPKQVKLK